MLWDLQEFSFIRKVCHWGRALRVYSLSPLPVGSPLLVWV